MAALLITKTQEATTAFASIFGAVVPADTEFIITGLRVANKTGSAQTFEVKMVPATGDEAWIASQGTPLAVGEAIELLAGATFQISANDDIQIKAGANTSVTIMVTYKSRSTA